MITKRLLEIGKSSPPGSPAIGDLYYTAAAPSGAWSGKGAKLAICVKGGGSPGWAFGDPTNGDRYFDANTEREVYFDGTDWWAIVSTWQAEFGSTNATADAATRTGRLASSTTNQAGTLPANYKIAITSAEACFTMGATAGNYSVYALLALVSGTDVRLGAAFTGIENDVVRDWRFGSLLTPLGVLVGDGAARAIAGWENASGGSKALANAYHYVCLNGYLLRKLT